MRDQISQFAPFSSRVSAHLLLFLLWSASSKSQEMFSLHFYVQTYPTKNNPSDFFFFKPTVASFDKKGKVRFVYGLLIQTTQLI